MDTSKFKNVTQKLSFFKDYSSLLTPVVIAAVALLVLVLAMLMGSRHRKEMLKTSVSMGNKVMSLSKNVVPSGQWQVEQAYQQVHELDANETALLAKQATQRELLSYKLFPEPNESSTLIFDEFGRRFRSALEELLVRVNARDCPTEAELDRHFRGSGDRGIRGSGRQRSTVGKVEGAITDALCREKAESASVYANVADLAGYEFWREYTYSGMERAVKDCWYWQLGYWITEDVIDTIDAVNRRSSLVSGRSTSYERRGTSNVFTSPVKRLLAVSFGSGGRSGGSANPPRRVKTKGKSAESAAGGLGRETAYNEPSYVRTISDGFTIPCTARMSNDDIDVVHFRVSVVVDAKDVFSFMSQLCSGKEHIFKGYYGRGGKEKLGQFSTSGTVPLFFSHNQITILSSNIESIDAEDEMHKLYRYGEAAVVRLDLICEYIFNKDGYDEINPESIKEEKETQER